jgi:hypothetical protein
MRVFRPLFPALLATLACLAGPAQALDDGSQLDNPFRVNYAGYHPQAAKTAVYVRAHQGPIRWALSGTACSGLEDTYVRADKSSGDSFYLIDFSACTQPAADAQLVVGDDRSAAFDISADPYRTLKDSFFQYFKDHEAVATFDQSKNDWAKGLRLRLRYVRDAGDNGAYPVNTAEAAWALISLLETYPGVNTYYSARQAGSRTVYEQLQILTEQFNVVMDNPRGLAIPKFHTHVNSTWAACAPYTSGTCISEPETKATYATARTLAAMARLHLVHGSRDQATAAYQLAKRAFERARIRPLTCNQADQFGGEGGYYPDNDPTSIWRHPKAARDHCAPHPNNIEDDDYAAAVELHLAALRLGLKADAGRYRAAVVGHSRFAEISSFWWGAVAAEGSLSLLAHESNHTINLAALKRRLLAKAEAIVAQQARGYPGVTWDPHGTQWNTGDQDAVDNNVRWGSNRMALNDARLLMAAAQVSQARGQRVAAARYARGALKVLDYIMGVNAVNLAQVTAAGHGFIEHAITRTHDGADPADAWPGKMVLGANNWTNAGDPDMPPFGSRPGLKMFALNGRGWASREVSIDANAALVAVSYFASEIAPAILAMDPIVGHDAAAPAGGRSMAAPVSGSTAAR